MNASDSGKVMSWLRSMVDATEGDAATITLRDSHNDDGVGVDVRERPPVIVEGADAERHQQEKWRPRSSNSSTKDSSRRLP